LLSVGIHSIKGKFERGSLVQLLSFENIPIAVGLTHYASQEISQLIGLKTHQIEETLGYTCGNEIIHRDNLAIYLK
jgi:glutamate 5-kinase